MDGELVQGRGRRAVGGGGAAEDTAPIYRAVDVRRGAGAARACSSASGGAKRRTTRSAWCCGLEPYSLQASCVVVASGGSLWRRGAGFWIENSRRASGRSRGVTRRFVSLAKFGGFAAPAARAASGSPGVYSEPSRRRATRSRRAVGSDPRRQCFGLEHLSEVACTPPRRLIGWAFCQPVALRDVFKAPRRLDSGAVDQVMALSLDYVHATDSEPRLACGSRVNPIDIISAAEQKRISAELASVATLARQARPLYFGITPAHAKARVQDDPLFDRSFTAAVDQQTQPRAAVRYFYIKHIGCRHALSRWPALLISARPRRSRPARRPRAS